MSFHDHEEHEHRVRHGGQHGRSGYATVEIGRNTRQGIVVQLDGVTSTPVLRHVLELAFDVAGDQSPLRVDDPGWWAVLVGWAGMRTTGAASVQRVLLPGELHAVLVTEPGSIADVHPLWPLARLRPGGRWLDLRGETALRHGPSNGELEAYNYQLERPQDVATLRRMFDQGVIEWDPDLPAAGGRRGLRGAR